VLETAVSAKEDAEQTKMSTKHRERNIDIPWSNKSGDVSLEGAAKHRSDLRNAQGCGTLKCSM